jgi:hypothetical protein
MMNARPRGRGRVPTGPIPTLLLALAAGLAGGCNRNPAAPQCIGAIEIELSSEEVHPGDTFVASAVHRISQCITSLDWMATGVVQFQFAEGTDATFRATAEGNGIITVRNRQGSLGVLEVEVVPPEETAPAPMRHART